MIKLANSTDVLRLADGDPGAEMKKNFYNLEQILLNSNASPIRAHDLRGYLCVLCSKQFLEPHKLKEHFLEQHEDAPRHMSLKAYTPVVKLDITLLNCALCDTDLDSLQDLMVHLIEVHNKTLYMDVRSQLLPFKFDTPELRCAICSTEYLSFKLLQEHMNGHFRNYICCICNAGFVLERFLKIHIRRHDNVKVKCSECEKIFINSNRMQNHLRRIHMGLRRPNKCHYCNLRFRDYEKKVEHMIKEHGVPSVVFNCGACDGTFVNQRALTRHTRKHHLMERNYLCPYCDMTFFNSSHRNSHLLKHTGIRKFKCDICSREFARKVQLIMHMQIHMNTRKRFACGHCGASYIQRCRLKSHLQSKHDEIV